MRSGGTHIFYRAHSFTAYPLLRAFLVVQLPLDNVSPIALGAAAFAAEPVTVALHLPSNFVLRNGEITRKAIMKHRKV